MKLQMISRASVLKQAVLKRTGEEVHNLALWVQPPASPTRPPSARATPLPMVLNCKSPAALLSSRSMKAPIRSFFGETAEEEAPHVKSVAVIDGCLEVEIVAGHTNHSDAVAREGAHVPVRVTRHSPEDLSASCPCGECRLALANHHHTAQITGAEADVHSGSEAVVVRWADGHVSKYSGRWLLEHSSTRKSDAAPSSSSAAATAPQTAYPTQSLQR